MRKFLFPLFSLALFLLPQLALAGSQTFPSSGTFTVPAYGTLTVEVWGGGGGGGGSLCQVGQGIYAGAGGASSFASAVQAGGGAAGGCGIYRPGWGYDFGGPGGSGGAASGGDTGWNLTGSSGATAARFAPGGVGGASASGGGGGTAGNWNGAGSYPGPVGNGGAGGFPGGGGGGTGYMDSHGGGGGGGGAYAKKKFVTGGLTPGSGVPVVVGAGGTSGVNLDWPAAGWVLYGGTGGAGQVSITWTDPPPALSCNGTPETYSTPGTYTRSIPSYASMAVEAWGGGGAGGSSAAFGWSGSPSTASTFAGISAAGGGTPNASAGAGGVASGGDTNTTGGAGASGGSFDAPNEAATYGGSSPNGGSGATTQNTAGSSPGGGGAGKMTTVFQQQPQPHLYYISTPGGGGGAYSKKTYSSGALVQGSSVTIAVGSGASSSNGGSGAPGRVTITCSTVAPPTAHLTLPSVAYVGQPFTVSSTFTAGAGDTLTYDNIDWSFGGGSSYGQGANTFASSPKSFSTTTMLAGTHTFYAKAKTSSYDWGIYDTQTLIVTLPNAPTATLSVNSGTHYAGSPLTITAVFSTSTGDLLLEDNVDSPLGTGLGLNTNPNLTKIISFTPSTPGTYTFYARARSSARPSWATYQTLDVVVVASCTPSSVYSCSGQNIVQTSTSAQCAVTTNNSYASCSSPTFCSAGSPVCINPTPSFTGSGNLTGHLQVFPNIVAVNNPTTVYWNVSNVSSCSVTGSNGDGPWGSGPHTTSNILARTTYTLDCTKLNGTHLVETATVNVAPKFNEK